MSRYLRHLRIAFSAVCGIICLLLIVLWVRSYTWADIIVRRVSTIQTRIDSGAGFVAIQFSDGTLKPKWHRLYADHFVVGNSRHTYATEFPKPNLTSRVWGHFEFSYEHCGVCVPYWFLLVSFATLAVIPWRQWRFSLRTLLIAMTLVAVVLGLVVWAAK